MDDTDALCSVHDLMRPYDDVLVDRADVAEIGPGWRAITEHLLASLAREVRLTPGARLCMTTVYDRLGALRIISEAAGNLPPGHLDLHEVRRTEREAEDASLRTCSCCGQPGVLRHVEGGFATRCERHVDRRVAHPLAGTAYTPLEVTMNLTQSHADWLSTGEDTSIDVPRGWLPIAVEALATSQRFSRGATGFRLLGMRGLCGRLDIRIGHEDEPLDLPDFMAWRSALLASGDAAFFTCEICGAPGRIRPTERGEGAPPPRCDAHADLRKVPSRQATIRRDDVDPATDDVDPAFVISSSRSQWTVSAARLAARQPVNAPVAAPEPADAFVLYEVRDVMAALGLANDDKDVDPFDVEPSPPDNEHQSRLRRIVQLGEAGRWRRLARPTTGMVDRLDALARRAPHLQPLSSLVRRHLQAAINIGLPVTLPPTLVLGPPGVGKTWFLTALADVLDIPFRSHAMSAASHSDGIGGAHPVWRNAQTGLIANRRKLDRGSVTAFAESYAAGKLYAGVLGCFESHVPAALAERGIEDVVTSRHPDVARERKLNPLYDRAMMRQALGLHRDPDLDDPFRTFWKQVAKGLGRSESNFMVWLVRKDGEAFVTNSSHEWPIDMSVSFGAPASGSSFTYLLSAELVIKDADRAPRLAETARHRNLPAPINAT